MKEKKVLIVEDESITRKMLTQTVNNIGLATVQTSNGRLAWELLQDNPDFSLLITDVMMPEMDGRDLVRAIRESKTLKDLPIIIISGVVSLREIKEILELGASRFVPKPLMMDDIRHYVKNLMQIE